MQNAGDGYMVPTATLSTDQSNRSPGSINQGMLLLGSNHFLKKVAVHDDSFVENIDFDAASLSPVNEGPDTDVYIEAATTHTEHKSQKE